MFFTGVGHLSVLLPTVFAASRLTDVFHWHLAFRGGWGINISDFK